MSIRSKLSVLVQLANVDGDFAGEEKEHIYMLGKVNGISKEEIDAMVETPEPMPPVETMTEDDKFEYLYHIVQLMKIDSAVYMAEIKYCEALAQKLGFNRKVIAGLSSKIYSDPAITSDVSALKREIKKYS